MEEFMDSAEDFVEMCRETRTPAENYFFNLLQYVSRYKPMRSFVQYEAVPDNVVYRVEITAYPIEGGEYVVSAGDDDLQIAFAEAYIQLYEYYNKLLSGTETACGD